MKRLLPFLLILACNRAPEAVSPASHQNAAPAANAERGRQLAAQYGCNVCHVVPGVDGPQGSLGPSLAGVAARPTISLNTVPNNPENLTRFIQDPAALNPQSSMPPMAIPVSDAQDITAFLLTLK
jgi:cytochrome c